MIQGGVFFYTNACPGLFTKKIERGFTRIRRIFTDQKKLLKCGVSNNHHEGHEDNEEKKLQALHVLHGNNNRCRFRCQNVITASYLLLYKDSKKNGGGAREKNNLA